VGPAHGTPFTKRRVEATLGPRDFLGPLGEKVSGRGKGKGAGKGGTLMKKLLEKNGGRLRGRKGGRGGGA